MIAHVLLILTVAVIIGILIFAAMWMRRGYNHPI